ncbi:hypothetical protein B998_00866, partial [Brucella sp. F96/2]
AAGRTNSPRKICFDPVPLLICKASSAHGCSPLTTLNQNFVQKGILECRQALKPLEGLTLRFIEETLHLRVPCCVGHEDAQHRSAFSNILFDEYGTRV